MKNTNSIYRPNMQNSGNKTPKYFVCPP